MKYNEAIDMILDGGVDNSVMRVKSWPEQTYWVTLYGGIGGVYLQKDEIFNTKNYDWLECFNGFTDLELDEDDFRATDWIVEKDGVVYEEYPYKPSEIIENRIICMMRKGGLTEDVYTMLKKMENGCYETCALCHTSRTIFIKDRIHEQDEPIKLKEGGEPWKTIKMPIRADEVNEDWLEKKILCFAKRYNIAIMTVEDGEEVIDNLQDSKYDCNCGDEDCPFCFPEEKQKESKSPWKDENIIDKMNECIQENCIVKPKHDHIPDVSNMVDEPREKVTVHELMSMIYAYGNRNAELYAAMKANGCAPHDPEVKPWKDARENIGGKIQQKLEYLVSFQEK